MLFLLTFFHKTKNKNLKIPHKFEKKNKKMTNFVSNEIFFFFYN